MNVAAAALVNERTTAAPPADLPLVDRIAVWARTRPDATAYTFVDYTADPTGVPRSITWLQVHQRATALAQRIARSAAPRDRVAVLAPSGLDYIVGLFGAWYAQTIAVPLFPPMLAGQSDRLACCYDDCAPVSVLTVSAIRAPVAEFVRARGRAANVIAIDDPDPTVRAEPDWRPPTAPRPQTAYLQYTSGSTRAPAGVEISHRNLTANVRQIASTYTAGRDHVTGVNWLPLFHDMGMLSTVAMPLWAGTDAVLLDPTAFLLQPSRWLRLISGRASVYTCSPNFAYEYCLRRLRDRDLDGLDLAGVFLWLNGAEPVQAATMARFADLLAGAGLNPAALSAAYGLAEATVFVAGDRVDRAPTTLRLDRDRLAGGEAVPVPDGRNATELVSCGRPADQLVAIVDPDRWVALPDGRVGEIWVHGDNVARRYWRQDARSAQTFGAVLPGAPPELPDGPWLRTGDLGLLVDGELYVTGRLKDLLIVAGRNHYPQDVEETVADADPRIARGDVAAFAVPVDGEERVVVVAERRRGSRANWQPAEVTRAARHAVWTRHELALHDVVAVGPGDIPRTSSGKISRTACREHYLTGLFDPADER